MKRAIPNILTLGNLYCGFMAINSTINGNIREATILIFIAIMLDAIDGRVARILGVSNNFGKELDSLADIVSFGVVPAFLVSYAIYDGELIGIMLAGLFPLFGAYRLARFNLTPQDESEKYFRGIPITLAGAIVTFLVLFENYISDVIFAIIIVTLAILMVSTIRIPSLKDVKLPKNGIITTAFVVYLIYLFTGVKPENIPLSFYVVLIIYVAFISIRFIKEKEPKFKKPKWIKMRKGSGKIIFKKKK